MRALGHRPFGIDLDGLTVDESDGPAAPAAGRATCNDLVFENVQARMRTSILMNSGFVIGTGDVSELALGWCTYNGDHMSMYNPNSSIPKTLVKFLVDWAARNEFDGEARRTLLDIVDTLISPELLPVGADGTDRCRPPRASSAPTSCTTSSCSTSSATARRRKRSCSWPDTPQFDRDLHAGRGAPLAAGVPAALLRQPVQALVPAGRAEGRLDQPVAARRLAHAQRRPGGAVAALARSRPIRGRHDAAQHGVSDRHGPGAADLLTVPHRSYLGPCGDRLPRCPCHR